jgi:thiamine-monophosphate kinase
MSEFDLIQRYFTRSTPSAILGVGDDAALLKIGDGMELAVSTDMMVSGTHFFSDADPMLLGHKTLAVNLSDLAAMGATPRWATLALSLPEINESWLKNFSNGFFSLAEQYGVELIGGDTTRGPLNLCVTIMGEVANGKALRRDGAKVGDDIWVSGTLGEAALALAHLQNKLKLQHDNFATYAVRLHQPQPRVSLGHALSGIANSAIDISDGLLADLGHILERSKVGAEINYTAIRGIHVEGVEEDVIQRCVLAGGDDYELCFTASAANRAAIQNISVTLDLPLSLIGRITIESGCNVHDADGRMMQIKEQGYDHFGR